MGLVGSLETTGHQVEVDRNRRRERQINEEKNVELIRWVRVMLSRHLTRFPYQLDTAQGSQLAHHHNNIVTTSHISPNIRLGRMFLV